jgi:aromatic ring-opening dioxygenase LigB subunit
VPITSVSILPAAPLLLPAASPSQPADFAAGVEQLRAAVDGVLRELPAADTALLLVPDDEALVIDAPQASLASYGLADVISPVVTDEAVIAAISARGQAPRVRSDHLTGDVGVLALLLASARPGLALAPATVPRRASSAGLDGIAMGFTRAISSVQHDVAVIAAGDLAATLDTSSPGYLVEGATAWDEGLVAAVRAGDPQAAGALGPEAADRVQARGWAPITVALSLARACDWQFSAVTYLAPKGVGQIVAG